MMKTWIVAAFVSLSLLHASSAMATKSVTIAIYSGYHSDIINNKISAFVDNVSRTLQRPVRVVAISGEESLRQLLQKQQYVVIFMPSVSQPSGISKPLTPLVQTTVPLGLFARPGKSDLSDLKKVAIPVSSISNDLYAELRQLNPDIVMVPQLIGSAQLRTLAANDGEGVVMTVGLFNNLAASMRSNYVQRFAFQRRLPSIGWCTAAFTPQERQRLQATFLSLPADAMSQLRQTFGVTGFEPYSAP